VSTVEDSSIMVGCAPAKLPPLFIGPVMEFTNCIKTTYSDYCKHDLLENGAVVRKAFFDIRDMASSPLQPDITTADPAKMSEEEMRQALNVPRPTKNLRLPDLLSTPDGPGRDTTDTHRNIYGLA